MKIEKKYTQRPWNLLYHDSLKTSTITVKITKEDCDNLVAVLTNRRSDDEFIANSELIAAAPDMAEALIALVVEDVEVNATDAEGMALAALRKAGVLVDGADAQGKEQP